MMLAWLARDQVQLPIKAQIFFRSCHLFDPLLQILLRWQWSLSRKAFILGTRALRCAALTLISYRLRLALTAKFLVGVVFRDDRCGVVRDRAPLYVVPVAQTLVHRDDDSSVLDALQ